MIGLRKIKIPNYLKPQFGPHEPRMARPETAATHSCKVPQMTAAHSCTEPPQSPNSFDLTFHLFFPVSLASFVSSLGGLDWGLRLAALADFISDHFYLTQRVYRPSTGHVHRSTKPKVPT